LVVPSHYNQHFASTTQLWNGSDSEENFKKNCAIPESRKILEEHGWLVPESVTYKFNSEGFRDEEFDQQPAGIAIGCSHTQGIGIKNEHTWPSQLQSKLGHKIWNLGVGGSALDTCYRLLDHWIKNLNVKFVICVVPGISRYEICTQNNWTNFLPMSDYQPFRQVFHRQPYLQGYHKEYLMYDQNSIVNRQKNLHAMKYVCHLRQVPFYYDLLENFDYHATARDLLHTGGGGYQTLVNKFFNSIKENKLLLT
jgi:hypothetical protein